MSWVNMFGLTTMVLMMIPNIVYAYKNRDKNIENKCKNKSMNIIEQIGRYGSMFLMVFNNESYEFNTLVVSIGIMILMYYFFWFMYFKNPKIYFALALAIIPSMIFILSGIMMSYLLIAFGLIFSIGHIYVTYENNK